MYPRCHQPRPSRPRNPFRRRTRKTLADVKLDGDLSPAETSLLDLLDIWDVLSATYQSPASGNDTEDGGNDDNVTSTLKRLLSLNPNISAVPSETAATPPPPPSTSTLSRQHPEDEQQEEDQQTATFRKIGAGQCGAIFAPSRALKTGGQQAFKFAKVATSSCSPAQKETSLLNEDTHHLQIFKQFRWFLGDTNVPHNNNINSAEGSPAAAPVMGITMPRVYGFTFAEDTHPNMFRDPYWRGLTAAAEREGGIHQPLPTDFLDMERIFPLPLQARNALIDRFLIGTEEAKQAAKNDPANADCLARVYLGANKESPTASHGTVATTGSSLRGSLRSRFFSLRNFKLHLNQLSDLGLEQDALCMAKEMAFALAIMHWAAKTDARDAEFVLGSSRERPHKCPRQKSPGSLYSWYDRKSCPTCLPVPSSSPSSSSSSSSSPSSAPNPTGDNDASASEEKSPEPKPKQGEAVRSTQLWLLDFNQCRTITFTQDGVSKMIEAIKLNDPYYPKPLRQSEFERAVWTVFVRAYLAASELILEEELGLGLDKIAENLRQKEEMKEIFELPRRFILGVIELERGRIEQRGRTCTFT